jgi:hypothetical protein
MHHVGIGIVVLDVENNHLVLRDVRHILPLVSNLVSVGFLREQGYKVSAKEEDPPRNPNSRLHLALSVRFSSWKGWSHKPTTMWITLPLGISIANKPYPVINAVSSNEIIIPEVPQKAILINAQWHRRLVTSIKLTAFA